MSLSVGDILGLKIAEVVLDVLWPDLGETARPDPTLENSQEVTTPSDIVLGLALHC